MPLNHHKLFLWKVPSTTIPNHPPSIQESTAPNALEGFLANPNGRYLYYHHAPEGGIDHAEHVLCKMLEISASHNRTLILSCATVLEDLLHNTHADSTLEHLRQTGDPRLEDVARAVAAQNPTDRRIVRDVRNYWVFPDVISVKILCDAQSRTVNTRVLFDDGCALMAHLQTRTNCAPGSMAFFRQYSTEPMMEHSNSITRVETRLRKSPGNVVREKTGNFNTPSANDPNCRSLWSALEKHRDARMVVMHYGWLPNLPVSSIFRYPPFRVVSRTVKDANDLVVRMGGPGITLVKLRSGDLAGHKSGFTTPDRLRGALHSGVLRRKEPLRPNSMSAYVMTNAKSAELEPFTDVLRSLGFTVFTWMSFDLTVKLRAVDNFRLYHVEKQLTALSDVYVTNHKDVPGSRRTVKLDKVSPMKPTSSPELPEHAPEPATAAKSEGIGG